MTAMPAGILHALLATALFGASTPLAKLLLGQMAPTLVAGLLYAGRGIGLCGCLLWRAMRQRGAAPDLRAGAIVAGGVAGPLLRLAGLAPMPVSASSCCTRRPTCVSGP